MTLPASGTITMSDIVAEFGGTANHAISEYYRGGGLVPDTAANAGIPTSGEIRFSDFYGATAVSFFVPTGTYDDINPIGGGAGFTLAYSNTGIVSLTGAVSGTNFSTNWVTPTSEAPGSYHIRAVATSGSFTTGTMSTDLALTTSRSWTLTLGGSGSITVTATFTLKDGFGGSTLATNSITLNVGSA